MWVDGRRRKWFEYKCEEIKQNICKVHWSYTVADVRHGSTYVMC